jgi:hypothetical protein
MLIYNAPVKIKYVIRKIPSNGFLLDEGALQARSWREIFSSTAFNNDKHFSSPSPLRGRP